MKSELQEALLVLGLEDLIPLPEAYDDPEILAALPSGSFQEFRSALETLLDLGLGQIWTGHWDDEPQVCSTKEAFALLQDEGKYTFKSPSDLVSRVYFANVENIRG